MMNILVTLDKNYLPPLKTMLMSLFINHPGDSFDMYLASDDLTEDDLEDVFNLCKHFHSALHLIHVRTWIVFFTLIRTCSSSTPFGLCMKRSLEILSMRRAYTKAS